MLCMSLYSIPFHVSLGSYILHLKIETLCISYYMYIEKSVICGKLGYKSSYTTSLDFFVLCHFHITFHLLSTSEIEQKRLLIFILLTDLLLHTKIHPSATFGKLYKNVFLIDVMGSLITLYKSHMEIFLEMRLLHHDIHKFYINET